MNYKYLIAYLGQSKSRPGAQWKPIMVAGVISKCTNLSYILRGEDNAGLKLKIDSSCAEGEMTELDESDWQYWYSSTYSALFAEPKPKGETARSLGYDGKSTLKILDYLDDYYYSNNKPKNTYVALLNTL